MRLGLNQLILITLPILLSCSGCPSAHVAEQQADSRTQQTSRSQPKATDSPLGAALRAHAYDLSTPDDLGPLFEAAANTRLALLGESSHGTSEFYTWRAAITQRLIEDAGFSLIVVEGDWASIHAVNRYIKGLPDAGSSAREVLADFNRWPTWMWANEETVELVEWLAVHNSERSTEERVGFFGMDVYGVWDSKERLRSFFTKSEHAGQLDEAQRTRALKNLDCLRPFRNNHGAYIQALRAGQRSCETETDELVQFMQGILGDAPTKSVFVAKQDAWVLDSAERHFRDMGIGTSGWNARARHMHETVQRLLARHGDTSRAIVWAHNTHIGDARATSMAERGDVNIGQLSREAMGDDAVFAVGFGTHRGQVIAGARWGTALQTMDVPEAMPGSLEDAFHGLDEDKLLVVFGPEAREHKLLAAPVPHRAIGVVYNPEREQPGNYVPTRVPLRYDAFIYIGETAALKPL